MLISSVFLSVLFSLLMLLFYYVLFKPILISNHFLYSNVKLINIIISNPILFSRVKILFFINAFFVSYIFFTKIFESLVIYKKKISNNKPDFSILIGKDENSQDIFLTEKSLYQNILITGSIGCGKTSSAMYPFTRQLINYQADKYDKKLGFLILDVKGNYYSKIKEFALDAGRLDDLVVIELDGKYKYNPLDKQNIKASVLANRLKSILLLFSPNNSESYWLDVSEQVLESAINFCRIYNSRIC